MARKSVKPKIQESTPAAEEMTDAPADVPETPAEKTQIAPGVARRRSAPGARRNGTVRPKRSGQAINIQHMAEERLLPAKLLRQKKARWPALLGLALIVVLASAGFWLYSFLQNTPKTQSDNIPEIIVPETDDSADREGADEQSGEEDETSFTPDSEPVVITRQIEVLDTPTGFLNVRSGPGTNFDKIGEVEPGGIYALVGEDAEAGWYQIRLADGTSGWVTKQYAREQ